MKHGVTALVGVASFGLYLATLAPTVTFVDSGELIVAALGPGVAHPPGFPLYTLLAHAATWLPFGNVAERVHLASAVFASLSAAVVTLLVLEMLPAATLPRRGGRRRGSAPVTRDSHLILAAAVGGLLLATSRTLWAYATIAEVYTLTILLVVTTLLFLVRWRRGVLGAGEGQEVRHRFLYAAAGTMGLGLGVHHVTVGLMVPAFAVLVHSVASARRIDRSTWFRAAVCLLAGLTTYLYLPVVASGNPVINWGDPSTPERFWWHVTGRQYRVFLSFSLETMVQQAPIFARYVMREFGPPWFPLALGLAGLGFLRLRRSDKTLATSLALIVVTNVVYALNYDIAEDKDAYYLPTFVTIAMTAGIGAARVLSRGSGRTRFAGFALMVLVGAAPAASTARNLRFDDRSRYWLAHDYVTNILSTVEPGGMILTREWQFYSPWWYTRHVEGLRPDVVNLDVNLLRRSWYLAYLEREYPAVMQAARTEVDAFMEDLARWERDPGLYERDVGLNTRINTRFYGMIMALVETHLSSRTVYVTQDLLSPDEELSGRLAAYQRVPQGLIFEVTRNRGFVQPAEPVLETRGLVDGTLVFEPDDVVRVKVAPVYVGMLINRGRYLASYGRLDRARALYLEALALDPANAAARASLDGTGSGSSWE